MHTFYFILGKNSLVIKFSTQLKNRYPLFDYYIIFKGE
jgi:hypothetical protein